MQLEQSTYTIYRFLIKKIPKCIFIILFLTLAISLMIDLSFVLTRKPIPQFKQCLEKYYDQTHTNVTNYVDQLILNNQKVNKDNVVQQFLFTNSSTLLDVYLVDQEQYQSSETCIIKTSNFQEFNKSHPFLHISTSSSLLKFDLQNLSDDFIKKHNLHRHTITISKTTVDPGFLYFYETKIKNQLQVLVESMGKSLIELNTIEKQKRLNETKAQKDENQEVQNKSNEVKDHEQKREAVQAVTVVQDQNQDEKTKEEKREKRQKFINETLQIIQDASINSNLYFFYHPKTNNPYSRIDIEGIFGFNNFQGIFKIIGVILIIWILHLISIVMGLFVRLLYIFFISLVSLFGAKCLSQYLGWVHQYIAVVRNASTPNKIKLLVYVVLAILLSYGILTFGQYQLTSIFIKIYSPFLNDSYYWDLVIRNVFIIQLLHYILCRTRTSLRFCPYFSMIISVACVSYCQANPVKLSSFVIHFHLFAHFLLFTAIALIEKIIKEDQFTSEYQPTFKKPRMIFYMGFDLDWHKSIPPLWTYFMKWYDWTFVGDREKVYLQGDYQLLYGRLLGMEEPQELPQQMEQQQQQLHPAQELSESHASNI